MTEATRRFVEFRVSGTALSTIRGSELSYDPVKYDGGSKGAREAREGLRSARGHRQGRGWTYIVQTTPEGADTIRDYCQTVGETFSMESEPETKAEGRALLIAAARIAEAMSLDDPAPEVWCAEHGPSCRYGCIRH